MDQTASFSGMDFLAYCLLGLMGGVIGAVFVRALKQTMRLRHYLVTRWRLSPVLYSLLVVLLHLAFYNYSTLGMLSEDVKLIMGDIGTLQDDYV